MDAHPAASVQSIFSEAVDLPPPPRPPPAALPTNVLVAERDGRPGSPMRPTAPSRATLRTEQR